jgi:hypothetical protein
MVFNGILRALSRDSRPVASAPLTVKRLPGNPIVRPDMLPEGDGDNINGPSLIRAPDWLPDRLARYYLYFAHHHGRYIRLAVADRLEGPWTIVPGGALTLSDAPGCRDHVASPDVIVDDERKQIRLYFHGVSALDGRQMSFVALSPDGRHFKARDDVLGTFYFRVVRWRDRWIAMAKGGVVYRSTDGLSGFERNPRPAFRMKDKLGNAPGDVRHVALHLVGDTLLVYYTRIGDAPEAILRSRLDLSEDPRTWVASAPSMVLRPETDWEGARLPVAPSTFGASPGPENAVRDPAIFAEDGRVFLLYSVAGESGIAIAEILEAGPPIDRSP